MNTLRIGLLALLLGFTAVACTSEETSSKSGSETEAAAPAYLDYDAIEKMVDEDDEGIIGKEITITGISWGVAGRMDGTQSLDIGKEKLEGFKVAPINCIVAGDVDLSSAKKDQTVVVKGKVVKASSFGNLSLKMEDCVLVAQ